MHHRNDNRTLAGSESDRKWPRPTFPWIMRMNWHDLLFMHWRVNYGALRRLIPAGLEIDTFDGSPWIGLVPFRMTGVAPRFVPNIPFMSKFPELNVRTYVTANGKPGVWFFCLEATNPIAVRAARGLFHLPYMDAKISMDAKLSLGIRDAGIPENWIEYRSQRTHRHEPPASLRVDYRPIGPEFYAEPNSIEEFLTARYCLYSANARNNVFWGEVDHPPWQIREAQAIVKENTMTDWLDIDLPDEPPLLHFAKLTRVVCWPLNRIED